MKLLILALLLLQVALSLQQGDVCTLKPEVGFCKARIQKYYYDAISGVCKIFFYGGCGGNGNNFETIDECEAACAKVV